MSSGLISAGYDEARRARGFAETVEGRLTAARASALENLDHPLLEALGPAGARPVDVPSFGTLVSSTTYDTAWMRPACTEVILPNSGASLVTALSIAGSGVLWWADMSVVSGVTVGVELSVDGAVVQLRTGVTAGVTGILPILGRWQVGTNAGTQSSGGLMIPVPFRSSLQIRCAANATSSRLYYYRILTGAPA